MRSRTSFFNPTIFGKNVRRFWPLWGAYLAIWVIILPVALLSMGAREVFDWRETVLKYGVFGGIILGAVFGVFSAMAMWGFLYNARSAHGVACLPVRREELYVTNVLSGFLPLLASNLIVALLTVLAAGDRLDFATALEWFALVSLIGLFFYGFATLCAMLTGHLLVLPAVYVILNFVAAGAEYLLRSVFGQFVYGMEYGVWWRSLTTRFFSPPLGYLSALGVEPVYGELALSRGDVALRVAGCVLRGWGAVIAYAAAGLLLLAGALLLLRRRRIETAGDVVAVRALKPVFRWCMALGCGLLLSCLMLVILFSTVRFYRDAAFLTLLAFLLLGAFIGWFASEMLMKKSFRVFSRARWAGYGLCCLVIAALMLSMRFDLFGYERYVPAADKIESVEFSAGGQAVTLKARESVEQIRTLHQTIIADKDWNERADAEKYRLGWTSCYLTYHLQNGRTVARRYELAYEVEDDGLRPGSRGDIAEVNAALNCGEAIAFRKSTGFPITRDNLYYGTVSAAMTAAECARAAGYDDPEEYLLREWMGYTPEEIRAMDPETRETQIAQLVLGSAENGYQLLRETVGDAFFEGGGWYYEAAVAALTGQIDYDRVYFEYNFSFDLTELWELYETCVLPDLAEGTLGRVWAVADEEYRNTVYNARVELGARELNPDRPGAVTDGFGMGPSDAYEYARFYTVPTVNAFRTAAWLRARGAALYTNAQTGG